MGSQQGVWREGLVWTQIKIKMQVGVLLESPYEHLKSNFYFFHSQWIFLGYMYTAEGGLYPHALSKQWAAMTLRARVRGSGTPSIPPVLSLTLSNVSYLRSSVLLSLLFSPACAFLPASSRITCCPPCHLHYPCCWSFKEKGQPWTSCSPSKCWSMSFYSGWRSGCICVSRSNAACSEDGSWIDVPRDQGWEIICVLFGAPRTQKEMESLQGHQGMDSVGT